MEEQIHFALAAGGVSPAVHGGKSPEVVGSWDPRVSTFWGGLGVGRGGWGVGLAVIPRPVLRHGGAAIAGFPQDQVLAFGQQGRREAVPVQLPRVGVQGVPQTRKPPNHQRLATYGNA